MLYQYYYKNSRKTINPRAIPGLVAMYDASDTSSMTTIQQYDIDDNNGEFTIQCLQSLRETFDGDVVRLIPHASSDSAEITGGQLFVRFTETNTDVDNVVGIINSASIGLTAVTVTNDTGVDDDASPVGDIKVVTLNDLSGNASHVTQATDDDRPLTKSNTIGGLNCLTFVEEDILKTSTVPVISHPITVFHVCVFDGEVGDTKAPVDSPQGSKRILIGARTGKWGAWAGTWYQSGVALDSNAHVISCVFNSSSSDFYVDGVLVGDGIDIGANTQYGVASIGGYDGAATQNWVGDLGEVLIYDQIVSDNNVALLNAYLKKKWGVS